MKTQDDISFDQTASLLCAWCNDEIPDDVEVFTIGAKARPGIDLGKAAGKIIPITLLLEKRQVLAIVPTRDSPAVKDGHDLIFMVCCESCAQALRNGLQKDWDIEGTLVN